MGRRRRTPEERLRAAQHEVLTLEGQVESRRRTRDTRRKIILGGALLARARTPGVERTLCETLVAEQTGGGEKCVRRIRRIRGVAPLGMA